MSKWYEKKRFLLTIIHYFKTILSSCLFQVITWTAGPHQWEAHSQTGEATATLISSACFMHLLAEGSRPPASVSLLRPSRSPCCFSRAWCYTAASFLPGFLPSDQLCSLSRPLSFSSVPCCYVVTAAPHPPKPSKYCLPLRCVTGQSFMPSLWRLGGAAEVKVGRTEIKRKGKRGQGRGKNGPAGIPTSREVFFKLWVITLH